MFVGQLPRGLTVFVGQLVLFPSSRTIDITAARLAEYGLSTPGLPRGHPLRFCCLLLLLKKKAPSVWIQKSGHGDGGIDSLEFLSAVLHDSTLRLLTLEPTNGC